MGMEHTGIQRQHLPVYSYRRLQPALRAQHIAEVVIGHQHVGVEGDSLAAGLLRLVVVPQGQ